jgi:hypothetical protein
VLPGRWRIGRCRALQDSEQRLEHDNPAGFLSTPGSVNPTFRDGQKRLPAGGGQRRRCRGERLKLHVDVRS